MWVSEVAWWWLAPTGYAHRPRWVTLTVRGVFLFMIANGAVVFVDSPRRWLGVVILGTLVATWWSDRPSGHSPAGGS